MKKNENQKSWRTKTSPVLRFTPTAWAKLLFLRDAGQTEIGGFGITSSDDLLFVKDIVLVEQECTWITTQFRDESVADFFDAQVDAGRRPEQFGRIWVHTHPASSAAPSQTDEETFSRVFGTSNWAVMFILARGGQSYARLRFNVGPGGEVLIPVDVDYSRHFAGSGFDAWRLEYAANVHEPKPEPATTRTADRWLAPSDTDEQLDGMADDWQDAWFDYVDPSDSYRELEYGYVRDF